MKVNALIVGAVLGAAGLAFSGCTITGTTYVHDHDHGYYGSPEPYVVAEPPPTGYVVVHRAPPPLREDRPHGARPGPEYVWVPGYWAAQGNDWYWVQGRWERPPHRGAVWVPPRYEDHGTEFHFSVGGWH